MDEEGDPKKGPNVLVLVIDAVGKTTLEYLEQKAGRKANIPNLSKFSFKSVIEQASTSADSAIGHREMVGIIDLSSFGKLYDSFPQEYIGAIEKGIGRKTIFNKMSGGMAAIEKNWEEHEKTGYPIIYPSQCDPAIQIAMNEKLIPVEEQNRIGKIAFELAQKMGIQITRSITRPYLREDGEVIRTANRQDIILPMSGKTLVDLLNEKGVFTVAVGKIKVLVPTKYSSKINLTKTSEIDSSLGLRFVHPKKKDINPMNLQGTVNALLEAKNNPKQKGSFIFVNLSDTDSIYGHSGDIEGSLKSIEEVDRVIPTLIDGMNEEDLIIVTADHGMDHREDYGYHNVEPLLLFAHRKGMSDLGNVKLGKGKTLAEVGLMASQMFGCKKEFIEECALQDYF